MSEVVLIFWTMFLVGTTAGLWWAIGAALSFSVALMIDGLMQ